jgi:hypothetical protein
MPVPRISALRHSALTLSAIALSLVAITCAKDTNSPPPGASQLAFKVDPTSAVAGASVAPAVVVEARDGDGVLVSDFAGDVTITLGANPGSGTLSGTTTIKAVAGVATFNSLSINKTGAGYRLKATSGSLTAATSATFDISAGPATQLAFMTPPPSGVAGTGLPAITVAARDALGNVADGFTGPITIALVGGIGGATLTGTTTVNAVAGIATFTGLSIDKVGSGYALAVTGPGLTGVSSAAFNVTPGAVSVLVVTAQPTSTVAGQTIAPAIVVTAQDNMGNTATGFTSVVTLAITPGSGSPGATLAGTATATASAGVATFSSLSIAKAGTAYALTASASGVPDVTTGAFDIAIGLTAKLVYVVGPSSTFAGAPIAPAVQVVAQDAAGNTDVGYTGNVTVALGANPGGATLTGTTTVAAVSGVATFGNLSLDKSGNGYTLMATATGLTSATSPGFDNLAAAGSQIVFAVQPPATATAGTGITPCLQVAVKDGFGNIATSFNGDVTLDIGTNPTGGALSGTTTVAAVAGVATFCGLSIDRAGSSYTLMATVSVLSPVASAAFNVAPGAADHLAFGQQPTPATAGVAISPAVTVRVLDALGNLATGFSGDVTVGISSGSGTSGSGGAGIASLSGATTVAATAGVASFATLSIDQSGTGYALLAASTGLTGATSVSFDVTAGPASKLQVSVQPGSTGAGAPITPAVQVRALDALGNLATAFTGNVTMAITAGTGTAGASLSGAIMSAAAGGVATFGNLSIDKAGAGYTLTATASGLSDATTAPFDVTVGAAAKLVFTMQPTTTVAGTPIATIAVTAQDAVGNPVPGFTGDVTVSIGTNPGTGTLSGTTTVAAVGGVASFSTLSIDKRGAGYKLSAAATGLTGATSGTFDITAGPAAQLVFTVQPVAVSAGANIAPAVVVTGFDQLGNVATGFTGSVTMTLGTNPSAGTLTGTTSVAAVAGVATFSALKIDKAGVGYTLTASATALPTATSSAFDVNVGVATKLVFTVPPVNTVAGTAITPAVQVATQDAAGNVVTTFVGNVNVAITAGTGTSGATLRGTTSVAAVGGIATFSTVSIDKSGTAYKLTTTSTGLTSATSGNFNITAAPAVKLGFTVQPPATATSGVSMSPTIRVGVQDSLGNTVTNFPNTNITMAIGTNPSAGLLTGTTTVRTSAGVSSFSTLKIDKAGVGYALVASMVGMLPGTSTPFTVVAGPATHLGFTTQPLSTRMAITMPPVGVSAFDAANNLAPVFTGNITVAIGTNPNFGTLTGTTVVKAVAGVSTFPTLTIDSAGLGYTLTAAAAGLTGATSAGFDITSGDKLAFTVQPPSTAAAGGLLTPAIQVSATDSLGAVLTGFSGNVTVTLAGGTAGAGLSGTKTVAAVAGVATFADLSVDSIGTGYTLNASASGLAAATSNAFNTVGGIAVKLGFIVQPSSTPAGAIILPGVVVAVQDAGGNTVKGISGSVTVAIQNNPSGGVLSGATTAPINGGVASFPNLSIDKVGTNYTLTATSLGLTSTTSSAFNVTTAASIHLAFSVQPTATTAGQIMPVVQVSALNASNAVVTSFTGPITLAIAAGTGANGAVLLGTTVVNAVNGVASFSDLSIRKSGTGFKFAASSPGTAGVNSASFAIVPDVAVAVHFSSQPVTTAAGAIIPEFTVDVRDQFSNVVRSFVGGVTISIAAGTGAPGAVLSGTKTLPLVSGVATFSDLSIDLPGTGHTAYRLSGSASGLASDLSNAFSIN